MVSIKNTDVQTNSLSEREISLLVSLLNKCTPGNLPHEVFEAVGRVAVYTAVEYIPLRKRDGFVEVLLLERPSDDIVWPSMLHTPGTILRPTDETINDAFRRLNEEELLGVSIEKPVFIGVQLSLNRRGRGLLLEHLVIVNDEPTVGKFYRVDELPDKFIPEQKASLYRAVSRFNSR